MRGIPERTGASGLPISGVRRSSRNCRRPGAVRPVNCCEKSSSPVNAPPVSSSTAASGSTPEAIFSSSCRRPSRASDGSGEAVPPAITAPRYSAARYPAVSSSRGRFERAAKISSAPADGSSPRASRMRSGVSSPAARPRTSHSGRDRAASVPADASENTALSRASTPPPGSAPSSRKRGVFPAKAPVSIRSTSSVRRSSPACRASRSMSPSPAAFSASSAMRPRASRTLLSTASPVCRVRRSSRYRDSICPLRLKSSPRAAETVTPGRAVLWAGALGAVFDVFTAAGCTGACPLILRMVNASMAMPPSG